MAKQPKRSRKGQPSKDIATPKSSATKGKAAKGKAAKGKPLEGKALKGKALKTAAAEQARKANASKAKASKTGSNKKRSNKKRSKKQGPKRRGTKTLPDPSDHPEATTRFVPSHEAVKDYLCPGCNRDIVRGQSHIVAVPPDDVDLRRHWHRGCWDTRLSQR